MYGPPDVNPRCVVEYDTVLMEKGKATKYRVRNLVLVMEWSHITIC